MIKISRCPTKDGILQSKITRIKLNFKYYDEYLEMSYFGPYDNWPILQEEPYVKKEGTRYTGFIPDLMEEIAEKANIEYTFHTVRDGKYGAEEGGRWNGMVGELLKGVSLGCSREVE